MGKNDGKEADMSDIWVSKKNVTWALSEKLELKLKLKLNLNHFSMERQKQTHAAN